MKKYIFIGLMAVSFINAKAQVSADPVLVDVDVKPTWTGCENDQEAAAREACLERNLTSFFNDFIIYPERARRKKIEGQVIAQFIVEKDGSVSNIQIIHDIGEGCGDEVIRAIQHLPKLVPGLNNGLPVRVLYKAPFHFKLK
jgi:periplasmic protein TonB